MIRNCRREIIINMGRGDAGASASHLAVISGAKEAVRNITLACNHKGA